VRHTGEEVGVWKWSPVLFLGANFCVYTVEPSPSHCLFQVTPFRLDFEMNWARLCKTEIYYQLI